MITFQNYHRHAMYTNTRVPDSVATNEDYAKRAKELGHGIISTVEHGHQGRYIEGYELAKKYDLKFLFGTEAYWVKDRFENDNTNAHICILAKNENGRQCINDVLAEANISGFYYQPRLDLELIFSLPKDDVWITSACLGFWKYKDDEIVKQLHNHFGRNFFLEVQNHNTKPQYELNKHIIDLSNRFSIPIIYGCDSHYITEDKSWERDDYIKSKGINYEDESGWFMDYPDGDTAYKRFIEQGALTKSQIEEAIENTNVFLDVKEYDNPCFNFEIKMPTLYPDLSQEEKDEIYENLVWSQWEKKKVKIPKEKYSIYEEEIKKEIDAVKTTKHADYFLIDYEIVEDAVENGGLITDTGRGSGVSYYTNYLLGFTKIDRVSSAVKMYPERFISPTRILESKSLADLDLNTANPEVFAESQKKILGEESSYPMIAYGTMKAKSAWKMYARAKEIDFDLANIVSDQIEKYENALKHAEDDEKDDVNLFDYVDEEYHQYLEDSKHYLGIVSDIKPHPCLTENTLVLTKGGYKRIKDINQDDYVITHTNTYEKVLHTMNKDVDEYYNVKLGGQILEVTGNHPFYVISNIAAKNGGIINRTEPYWKEAKDLKYGDLIGFAINNESIIPNFSDIPIDNKDFWWIIGRYLGDGYLSSFKRKYGYDKRINISCHKDEIKEIELKLDSLNIKYHYNNEDTNGIEIAFYNYKIWDFLKLFGQYAHGKYLPGFVFDLPNDLLKQMVLGYLSADGNITKNEYSFKTVSEKLAYGLQSCIHKVYKVACSIQIIKPTKGIIKGKEFIRKTAYKGRFLINPTNKANHIYKDGYVWIRFNSKEKISKNTKVYNLEVENAHSYTVNNAIVHNCGYLLYQGNIRREIGLIKIKAKTSKKEVLCTIMDGKWAEEYKFLKNDLLTVKVVELIKKVYKRIGIEPHEERELIELCRDNKKVWNVYKNGWTMGINQVEQSGTKHRVMKYEPKNISELCAFVAAIRPGFKSMYSIFENRESFSYDIPAFDDLIQTPEMPNSFLLYQEMSMTALSFAGVPLSECYEVIKNISKKRIEKVKKYKEIFLKGFAEKIVEVENRTPEEAQLLAEKVWQIIDDSCRYQFNASHAYSVATDSLYGAYLKSHYPLQFYEVFLNILNDKGDKDRIAEVKKEAELSYRIRFEPFKFRQDNRKFTADLDNNVIWSTLKSIKGFGDKIAQQLYELKDNQYDSFVDLLIELEEKAILCNKIESLIRLSYFSEFGNIGKLISIYNEFINGKFRYQRSHSDKTKEKRIVELKQLEETVEETIIPFDEQIKMENELLGMPISLYDLPKHVIALDVNTQNSPRIKVYGLKTGIISLVKINKKLYNTNKIKVGDVFVINKYIQKPKAIFLGNDENNKPRFEKSTIEKDIWIEDYTIKEIN